MNVKSYSEKSVAVYGDTKPWAKQLKSAGGLFNSKLRDGPGWIFSLKFEAGVRDLVTQANEGLITPETPWIPKGKEATIISPKNQPALSHVETMKLLTRTKAITPVASSSPTVGSLPEIPVDQNYSCPTFALASQPAIIIKDANDSNHQVAVYSFPLPMVGQKITVRGPIPKDKLTSFIVTKIKATYPVDEMTIVEKQTDDQDDEEDQEKTEYQVVIINGQWKILIWAMMDHQLSFESLNSHSH
jgi:hypothetical protein